MPKKNRAKRRRPKDGKGIYITDEAWEAARKSITAQNKNVIMLPRKAMLSPGEVVIPPRIWEYPVVWNLPKDPDAEEEPSATENPPTP